MAEILEEKVSKMTREMRSVRQEVQEMHSAYTDLKHRMDGLEDKFEELCTMNSSNRTSLSARLADNVKRVVKLTELQEESKSYLSTVQTDVYNHKQRLDALETCGLCSTHAASDTVADRPPYRRFLSRWLTTEAVPMLIQDQQLQHELSNNVIISGMAELPDENIAKTLQSLVPGAAAADMQAQRLDQPITGGKSWHIRVRTTAPTKTMLMKHRCSLKIADANVYVNHDLTAKQRAARRAVLALYKDLRKIGIACSLPRDTIMKDWKPVSEAEAKRMLARDATPQQEQAKSKA